MGRHPNPLGQKQGEDSNSPFGQLFLPPSLLIDVHSAQPTTGGVHIDGFSHFPSFSALGADQENRHPGAENR